MQISASADNLVDYLHFCRYTIYLQIMALSADKNPIFQKIQVGAFYQGVSSRLNLLKVTLSQILATLISFHSSHNSFYLLLDNLMQILRSISADNVSYLHIVAVSADILFYLQKY